MSLFRRTQALLLCLLFLIGSSPVANGCGPSFIEPVFVFNGSPDLPFNEFTGGNGGFGYPAGDRGCGGPAVDAVGGALSVRGWRAAGG